MKGRVLVSVGLALSVCAGIAVASPGGRAHRFRLRASGTITSVVQNQTTSSGTVRGRLLGHGSFSASEVTASNPTPCSSGPGSPASGSNRDTAANGDVLTTSFTGTVCQSASTPTSATDQFTGKFTITGGTGRFANATGGGTVRATATLNATPQGSAGPLTYVDIGRIRLSR
jgi:hypothetical protein